MATSKTAAETPLEPMISLDGLAALMNASRRTMERLRTAGKLPKADLQIGKMPRWKPETIRRWIAEQAERN